MIGISTRNVQKCAQNKMQTTCVIVSITSNMFFPFIWFVVFFVYSLSSAEESDRMLDADPRIVLRPLGHVEEA